MNANDLTELVRQKIENLRPKLLDLSRRNPLIATKLGPRSNSHIRVVDELPDILFFKLNNGQAMRLVPLPAIDDDPRDEQTDTFREALTNARIIDEQYLSAIESVSRDADDYIDRTCRIERALKDRIRDVLGLPQRTDKFEVNLIHHAKINGITPSYELPKPGAEHPDGRHIDDNIQTLLLPDDLERKLNAILSKCRTWMQETGMNVLHVAYGFLEWSDGIQSETSFAPLILGEAQIEKRRSSQGVEFSIVGTGDDPSINAVLLEMLRLNFGVELPPFIGSSVEKYLSEVAELSPKNMTWRVRRQVVIGVFPSARMAMYYDLDSKQPEFPKSEIIHALLGGTNTDAASPFAEEYEVDHPEIERKVPCLVMDADSSQFSTLVDLADGKNLAVEGPPGSGKSQMIVNAIAAALGEGKKVLFVAEKLAALNVVKSRLEAVGLGEFLLPLQAEKSTREQVITSVRERMEVRSGPAVRDYDAKLTEYQQTRQQIARYLELMARPFQKTGLLVREILGKSIATNPCLASFPPEALERCKVPETFLSVFGLAQLRQLGTRVAGAYRDAAGANAIWKATRLLHPERFTIEEACDLTGRASQAYFRLADARERLGETGLSADFASAELSAVDASLEEAQRHLQDHGPDVLLNLLHDGYAEKAHRFIERCMAWVRQREELSQVLAMEPSEECLDLIERTAAICERLSLSTIDPDSLAEDFQNRRRFLETARAIFSILRPLVESIPESSRWHLGDIAKAHALVKETGPGTLLYRNARTEDPDAVHILQALCAEGKQLKALKTELAKKISFAVETSVEELSECLSTLRVAGTLSIFSGRYRKAKRLFLSRAIVEKYHKPDAVKTLEALISFLRREAEFKRYAHASAVFGPNFRGVETEFEPFERLARYYRRVDDQFGQPDKRPLQKFLRKAELHELNLLPAIPAIEVVITYESLQERIRSAEADIRIIEEATDSLGACVHVFAQPKWIGPDEVRRVKDETRSAIEEEVALNQSEDVRKIIGENFHGARTQTHRLKAVLDWAFAGRKWKKTLSSLLTNNNLAEARQRIAEVLETERLAKDTLERVCTTAKIDARHFTDGSLREVAQRLDQAAHDHHGLFNHAVFATVLEEVPPGLFPLVEERLTRDGHLESLPEQFEALAIRQLAKAVYVDAGSELTRYRGSKLDELRAALAEQDREIIRLSRKQLHAKVFASARPPRGNGLGRKSSWTEMALLENETSKKQRFISVRDLTRRAGRALQELKPCWMMSPLAVAQYVPKESVKFDLCIIDEASQMPPESAIGALLRCAQTVVVGDTNQLPPTTFFKTVLDDEEADEDETVLNESILEMANATFRPARRLRWHYRSRHSALIKFSNRLIYDEDLIVFPSAAESLSRMGVEFRAIKGSYKAGTNPIEAKTMVEAALEFMRTDRDRSLGLVTFNQKQRDLISEEFEYLAGKDDDALRYIETWKERNDGLEEFFIKNLENVQGDERDVIFIGTVYGPEEIGGRVMQRFGPINGLAGRRRLNVLFTRAKQKIVTFSSMTASDITAEEWGNPGAYMLKRWLEYSASGVLEGGRETGREPDSDFELFVTNQIRSMGCEAVPQVGVAGYFIDIGVRHPDWPHGYILGVECDGASYHAAKSARDRDRLRQEVLEGLGWRLHRIWSTDWFNNPQREADKLRKMIAARLDELKQRQSDYTTVASPQTDQERPTRARDTVEAQLFKGKEPRSEQRPAKIAEPAANRAQAIAVGDTVRVRYLTDDQKTLQFTISSTKSDPSRGIVYHNTPIAKALLGAEEGDEVEVLVGSFVRPAVVEQIIKAAVAS